MLGSRFNLLCPNTISNIRYIFRYPNTFSPITKISLVQRNYATNAETNLELLRDEIERNPKYVAEFDPGILDPYTKPSQMPSIFSKEYYRILSKNARNSWKNFISAIHFCYHERKSSEYKDNPAEYWSPKQFKSKALDIYIEMNEQFALKNLKELKSLVDDQMFNKMKFEIKNREGKFIWKYHGLIEKPKYTNIRCALGPIGPIGNYLAQVTLKLHTKQSIGLYNKSGKLIAGDPKKIKNVLQYVVFQRKMWERQKGWTIYGYVQQG
ncbi:11826_t:CDS:2 [Funneliformis mosseae]|uniref:Large ribosomal subunit protein mL45 n=1 Tax=Funneliformis mosseae TaxID=27381 RepID=A0A9N9C8P8_FUNMO|nr:11826_t:CDS:2 [Funneliformis mosseae]